jgi:hypothetical protein
MNEDSLIIQWSDKNNFDYDLNLILEMTHKRAKQHEINQLYDKEYFKAIEYFKEQWSPKND